MLCHCWVVRDFTVQTSVFVLLFNYWSLDGGVDVILSFSDAKKTSTSVSEGEKEGVRHGYGDFCAFMQRFQRFHALLRAERGESEQFQESKGVDIM